MYPHQPVNSRLKDTDPTILQMALVNASSVNNKSSQELDFEFVTETWVNQGESCSLAELGQSDVSCIVHPAPLAMVTV